MIMIKWDNISRENLSHINYLLDDYLVQHKEEEGTIYLYNKHGSITDIPIAILSNSSDLSAWVHLHKQLH